MGQGTGRSTGGNSHQGPGSADISSPMNDYPGHNGPPPHHATGDNDRVVSDDVPKSNRSGPPKHQGHYTGTKPNHGESRFNSHPRSAGT